MPTKYLRISLCLLACWAVSHVNAAEQQAANPAATDIVKQCNFKYPGDDQKSTLTITLKDKDGNEKKNIYRRFWKAYHGAGGIEDKMVLFTEFPPDAQGAAFMRWGYTAQADKNADQWLYLPVLKKIRRVSIRDPGDSFLGSDLTYGDISPRSVDADEHRLLQVQNKGGVEYYAIESVPRENNALYGRTVSWYAKPGDWANCNKLRVDYFDKKGEPLKQELLKWQRVENAWIWDEVVIHNVQTNHTSIFQVRDVKINVGVKDDIFTERSLSLGP